MIPDQCLLCFEKKEVGIQDGKEQKRSVRGRGGEEGLERWFSRRSCGGSFALGAFVEDGSTDRACFRHDFQGVPEARIHIDQKNPY